MRMNAMMPRTISRGRKNRCGSHSAPPVIFSMLFTCKLLIFLLTLGDRTQNMWVRADIDHSQCFNDIYLSDENGDGKVDAEEYVEFCRLRLEERLQLSPDGYTYDTSSSTITSFVLLPSGLQSNFYILACLCSRFDFGDIFADKSACCIGDNAHLSVLSNDTAGAAEMDDDEIEYSNLLCTFTDRAINEVVSTMEIIQIPPLDAPVQTNTIIPTAAPSTLKPTTLLTTAPTTIAPTIRPTMRPSLRTEEPTFTPFSQMNPTVLPSIRPSATASSTVSSSSSSSSSESAMVLPVVQPTNITIKASYSILVEEQEPMTVDYLNDIHNDCIEGMNILATEVGFNIWVDENATWSDSVFYERLFVELPTSIDKIEEMDFTSAPELVDMDFDGLDTLDDNDKIFAGGPCPMEMKGSRRRKYNCFDVKASILLRVTVDEILTAYGVTADVVKDLYTHALQEKILTGGLATVHEETLENSTVIVATGQIVSENSKPTPQTKRPPVRVGIIVGLTTGALVLILILLYFTQRRRRRNHRGDEKETVANQDEDPEARNSPSSKSSGSAGAGYKTYASPSIQSNPYFQSDVSPVPSVDDTKSIGGISAESDAGWSDVYTSSMGSASDDGVDFLDSPPRTRSPGRLTTTSLNTEYSTLPMNTEGSDEIAPMNDGQLPATTSSVTPPRPSTVPDIQNRIAPVSPITPKSIQVLEETTSDKEDQIMIHEDFSDEEDGDKDEHESQNKKKESAEEFRARVRDLIERIVPEEIDQIDNMIAEFKNREEELVETLLAMEKRTLAQWRNEQKQKDDTASPPTPEREGSE